MELTFIGLAQLLIGGAIVLGGGLRSAFAFLIVSGLFGSSAAINLPAIGGSSILPVQFALLFVYLRILTPRGGFVGLLPEAIRANLWLVLFTLYGMAAAMLMPRIFAGAISVFPLKPVDDTDLFYTTPLIPTSQNITECIYLLGSLLIALGSWCTCQIRGGANTIVTTIVWVAWTHVALGIVVALAHGTPVDAYFDLFRNGSYVQLDAETDGFVRIRGLFSETSAFASFGFGLFVIMAELWFHSIRTRTTGAVALVLAMILFLSTSSTAYVGLFAYFLFFFLRAAALSEANDWRKLKAVFVCLGGMVLMTAILMVVIPQLTQEITRMVLQMTVEKSTSDSGAQRLFWTMQGFDAFAKSYGLGIGPGSYRSSSMLVSIVGTMGLVGIATFLLYLNRVVQPARRSTWLADTSPARSLGGAFGAASLLSLVPAAIGAPSPHADMLFSVLAGAAIALRPQRQIGQNHVESSRQN